MMNLRQVLKSRLKSQNSKVLVSNFSSLLCLQLANYVLPLITLPYLARVLGVEKFGVLAFAMSVITYFHTFVDFGFNYTAVRDIAKNRNNLKYVSEIFCTVMYGRIILMILSFCLLLVLIFLIPFFYENRCILVLTFLYIPGYILFPEWFFQAMEEMKYITILNIIAKLIFTSLIFIVIRSEDDYIYQPILSAFGFLVAGLISFGIIIKKFKLIIIRPIYSLIINKIRESWNMFITIFIPNIYNNFSTILLSYMKGEFAVGIFEGGTKLTSISSIVTKVLSRTFYPFLSRRIDKHDFFVRISLSISLLLSLVLFLGADFFIHIMLGNSFDDSIIVLKILALSPFLLGVLDAYGTNYLVIIHKETKLRNITVACSIVGFIISFPLIYFLGFLGASIVLLVTRGGMALWVYLYSYNQKKKRIFQNVYGK